MWAIERCVILYLVRLYEENNPLKKNLDYEYSEKEKSFNELNPSKKSLKDNYDKIIAYVKEVEKYGAPTY